MPIQGARTTHSIPEPIARLAHDEYARIYGADYQTFERLHERGGFGVGEVIALLADALERERAEHQQRIVDLEYEHQEELDMIGD